MTFMNIFAQFNIGNFSGFPALGNSLSFFPSFNLFNNFSVPFMSSSESWGLFNNWLPSNWGVNTTYTTSAFTMPTINYPSYSMPDMSSFNIGMYNANFNMPMMDTFTYTSPFFTTNSSKKSKTSKSSSGSLYKYANLSRSAALSEAAKDSNLEKLSGGKGWSVNSASFVHDIPYARKGTGAILTKVSKMINQELVITSALGTSGSPHVKNGDSVSHYNSNNPKLDIGGGLSPSEAYKLQAKLKSTGYFSRVSVETHGSTAHLDVQIKESAFESLA